MMKHVYKLLGFALKGCEVVFVFFGTIADMSADTCRDWSQWCNQKIEDYE